MDQQLTVPRRGGWRPGPTTSYPFLPSSRRMEWLVFALTPIGGCLAVNDVATGWKIIEAAIFISLFFFVPAGIRQMIHRLPVRSSLILEWTVGGILISFFVACGLLGIYVIAAGYMK